MHRAPVSLPRLPRSRAARHAATAIVAASLLAPSGLASAGLSPPADDAPLPADVAAALTARSHAADLRARELAYRREERDRVLAGWHYGASVTPSLDAERDLTDPAGPITWEPDVALDASVTYRYDRVARLDADMAVERAAARLRAQLRSDVELALLTLSRLRVTERAWRTATAERDALRTAAGASPPADLIAGGAAAGIDLALATLEVDQAELERDDLLRTLADLGVAAGAPWCPVTFDLPPLEVARHPQTRLLELAVAAARARAARAALAPLDEIELHAAYESGGVTVQGRVAWDGGRPEASAGVGWRPDDDHGWGVGVAARLRFDDAGVAATARAERARHDAEHELAAFGRALELDAALSSRTVDLAWREVALARAARDLAAEAAHDAVPTGAPGADRAVRAVHRAEDTLERAWQGYVRAVADHLDLLDVAWPTSGSVAQDMEDVCGS